MQLPLVIPDVNHAIQLALTPVFLLTGIAGLLNVMMGRLARIIDRGRHLATSSAIREGMTQQEFREELLSLEHRRHLASASITACTFSALMVCVVVGGLFLVVMLSLNAMMLIGALFTASTVALVVGLGLFLREVHLATQTVRIHIPAASPALPPDDEGGSHQ